MFRARIKVEGKNYQEMSDFQRRLDTIKLVLKQETWSETQQRLYQEMKNSTLFYTETKEGIFLYNREETSFDNGGHPRH